MSWPGLLPLCPQTHGNAVEQLAGASPRRPNPPRFLNPRPGPMARAHTYLTALRQGSMKGRSKKGAGHAL